MPELPEVEVTRLRIAPALVGRRIAAVHTTKPSYFFLTQPAKLRARLLGRRAVDLERIGKYLVATLDDGQRLVLHLGMTGQLFAEGASSVRLLSATVRASLAPEEQRAFAADAHTHLRVEFEGAGPAVIFRDVRKFGKVLLLQPGEKTPRLDRLGVDALRVTGADVFSAARKRTAAIKTLLLDQSVIAGVGNIYADEALFLAGVRSLRSARRVTRRECEALADALRQVLLRSIETGGSSISDYIAPDGSDGAYQDERKVYARKGEPCHACATPIRRIVIGQRSAHFCPRCQR
jgi:formamidopyrimidine-DNA glycosylase